MDSKTSKAKCHRTAKIKTKAAVVPRVPQEIVDEILDHLATDSDIGSLRACALVSTSWTPSSRRHLFHTVTFAPGDTSRWLKTFPVPEESPAHHVKDLIFSSWGYNDVPQKFLECLPWFTNVEKTTLQGHCKVVRSLLQTRLFWGLVQSITSLTIDTDAVNLLQVRDIILQLPNLDDLSLSGTPAKVAGMTFQGVGAALRGRFGGKLRLLEGCAREDVMNMLLEVPTGVRFTEVDIRGWSVCLLSAVRLVEACGEALVKLSYMVSDHCKQCYPVPWSSWF